MKLPRNLAEAAAREGRQPWLTTVLPAAVAQARDRWSLRTGEPFQPGGQTAWVAPARDAAGADLVLKVGWPHPEAAHEADGLRAWAGHGAVRLHAAHDSGQAYALLIERCRPGTELSSRPGPEQDAVIAALLRRLWVRPPDDHPFVCLEQMCRRWADDFDQAGRAAPDLDPGLVRAGLALFRELPATAGTQVLLCTDLHAGNVLAAAREPWLVIDPKPHVGDPAYDPLQHLLNCDRRLQADPRGLARRMAALLDLDPDRLLSWLFARCVLESPGCPALAEVARAIAPRG
ncbi:MAG TPA: aminoglycoside phosphotransferase family protein [Streptosporangiaceae bacterium]|nr:aminoglycoside phosphotransferase family protein [Streptosporangiaceae bacterium]